MGLLFYVIEGLQIRNTVFIKNVPLANEMQPVLEQQSMQPALSVERQRRRR